MQVGLGRFLRLCAFVAAFLGNGTASAQTILDLIAAGRIDEARAELDAQDATDLDRAFAEALIARAEGRPEDAAVILRAIVRVRPDLLPARRLFATVLAESEQYEAAEFQFERLREVDPSPENREAYTRAIRAIAAQKPFGFSASVALLPSTNINRGTAREIFSTDFGDFIIADESLETSGIGFRATASAFRRFNLGEGRRLQFDAVATTLLYENSVFNQHGYLFVAALTDQDERQNWRIAPEYARIYQEGDLSYVRYGITLARGLLLDERTFVEFGGRAEHRDYTTQTFLTGQLYEARALIRRRLDARTTVEGSLAYLIGETEAERFQYNGVQLGGRVTRFFSNGIRVGVGLEQEWRPYRGNFTGVSFPRNDQITTLEFSVLSDRWILRGAVPTYGCRFTWAQSNIAFYDYDVQECLIGFTRAF